MHSVLHSEQDKGKGFNWNIKILLDDNINMRIIIIESKCGCFSLPHPKIQWGAFVIKLIKTLFANSTKFLMQFSN